MNNIDFTYATNKFTASDVSAVWERNATHHFYAYYPLATTTETTAISILLVLHLPLLPFRLQYKLARKELNRTYYGVT